MRDERSATGSWHWIRRAEILAGEHSIKAGKAVAMNRRKVITAAGHDRGGRIATGRLG
jgi:hypothetical protein